MKIEKSLPSLPLAFKYFYTLSLACIYLVFASLMYVLPVSRKAWRSLTIRSTSFFTRIMLRMLDVRVQVKNPEQIRLMTPPCFIVSNHVSYLDILILSSLVPSVFVTSIEMKNTPLLGILSILGGSVFVERRNPSGIKKEIQSIADLLKNGFPVALFPESTTSNGDQVMPFKKSLFDAAIIAQANVLPVCIRYRSINKSAVTPDNRDSVFYYGEMTFLRHVPKLLPLQSIEVELMPLPMIQAAKYDSRKTLTLAAYHAINTIYHGHSQPNNS
ncbi:MAG: lysophospholipid acyltransferase family protein [Nitrospirota bacterium]